MATTTTTCTCHTDTLIEPEYPHIIYCPTHAHAFAMLATLRQIAYSDPSRGMHDKARAMVQTVEG